MFPSYIPTSSPTIKPTKVPSNSPTNLPSSTPTIYPTVNPTMQPSQSTQNPTTGPTVEPTNHPTLNPTLQPSSTPTITTDWKSPAPTLDPIYIGSVFSVGVVQDSIYLIEPKKNTVLKFDIHNETFTTINTQLFSQNQYHSYVQQYKQ